MRTKWVWMLTSMFVGFFAFAGDASITDVTARQRYPWNGKVDISYSVGGIEAKAKEEGLMTTLKVSAIDLTTGTINVATTLSGDVSLADGTHKIVWDMSADGLTFKSTNVVFNVTCETTPALYCIVDLSAGASATSYLVSYTNEIPGGSWSDEYKTTKLVMRCIEPGICVVTIDKPYYVGVFEVTQKQYELITGATPSYFSGNDKRPVEQVSYNMIRGSNKGAQYPSSTDVDDDSCVGKLRKRTGLHFDLPTGAQWEYACRAGTTTTYSYGDDANGDYMWYDSNSGSCTHDVGTRKANPWGLYDMHGNVFEWCLEWYPGYSGSIRVLRGGAYYSKAGVGTSSSQSCFVPSDVYYGVGFRLVRTQSDGEGGICANSSDVVTVDLTAGTRTAGRTETLAYSTEWVECAGNGATAVIAADGVMLSEQSGNGTVEWTPKHDGTYTLTHKVMVNSQQVGETLTATFVADGINPKSPVFVPVSGTTFSKSLSVSISCASEGATIHYTTDGSIPTVESPVYKKFKIYERTTVKAIAFYANGLSSDMAVVEYAPGRCSAPVIRPADGTVFEHSNQRVSIKCVESEGILRYTTDGSDPTEESPAYVKPLAISDTTTIKAKVFSNSQYFDSSIVTATLTRVWVNVATPIITAAETFSGSKNKVTISCATDGAAIYYTLDGSEPTTASARYEKPFCVTEGCTVKAMAVKDDYLDSDIATRSMTRSWSIGATMGKCDHAFATSGDLGFVRVDDETAALGESMKSGEIDDNQTSILSTTVVGPGTLSFKWKTSCEEDELHEWDHAEFVLDGVVTNWLDGVTDWQAVMQEIEGEGEHTVLWRYIKDAAEKEGDDCLWVSEYAWASDYTETQTTEVPVPYDWLTQKCCDVVDEYDSYESVAKQKALNKRLTVEQCYVAGVDPESTTNDFTTTIAIIDGVPNITWNPDLEGERTYKIWGSTNLVNSSDWEWPTNALHRFFKVTVEMP